MQVVESARGLSYLHSQGIVHCDFKAVRLKLSSHPPKRLTIRVGKRRHRLGRACPGLRLWMCTHATVQHLYRGDDGHTQRDALILGPRAREHDGHYHPSVSGIGRVGIRDDRLRT